MSYEPTVWKAGDTVTSAKLNKIEQGLASGGGPMLVAVNPETGALDKTWQEIYDAAPNVSMCSGVAENNILIINYCHISVIGHEGGLYKIIFIGSPDFTGTLQSVMFTASSPNDYPVILNFTPPSSDESEGK